VADVRVVNASPLITLAKVGRLDLLTSRGQKLLVPQPVADEILQGPPDDPARVALEGGFGVPFELSPVDVDVLGWSLGAGESAVLSIARSASAVAILDDYEARTAARALGLRLTGTLGIVIQAAQEGNLPSAAPLIRKLRAAGLRLNDLTISQSLERLLGETWEP
jgi:predicted nucleic acid-binding protein